MQIDRFIAVGENIHCTRIYKVGGKFVKEGENGYVIHYKAGDAACTLAIPPSFTETSDWEAGKIKHCAVAITQGLYGSEAEQQAGREYLEAMAQRQIASGATYLDINVDEFSTDVDERTKAMKWTVDVIQQVSSIPLSIDSSNTEILKTGLDSCDASHGRPMVNSVSLERTDAIDVACTANAVVIASAAGESGLPSSTEEKMANLDRLLPMLKDKGCALDDIHVDPLVLPISVDGSNGKSFLDAVSAVRTTHGPEIHIVAGLSNVSFGMPSRKLINQVFTYLAVEAGADGGIVDPAQLNIGVINGMDVESERFKLAKDLLTGADEFGMNFIAASREGTI